MPDHEVESYQRVSDRDRHKIWCVERGSESVVTADRDQIYCVYCGELLDVSRGQRMTRPTSFKGRASKPTANTSIGKTAGNLAGKRSTARQKETRWTGSSSEAVGINPSESGICVPANVFGRSRIPQTQQ